MSPPTRLANDAPSSAPPSGVLDAPAVCFHGVVDALEQLVIVLSSAASGDAQYVNRAGREYLGLDLAEARAGWRASVHADDLGSALTARSAGLAAGATGSTKLRLRRHDGEYRWFSLRVTPLRDAGGAITHWTAAFTDIEDTYVLGDRLRVEEGRLAVLEDVMPGVLVTFRRGPDGMVSFPKVNQRYFDLTGVPRERLERDPRAGYDSVHPDDLPRLVATIDEARRTLTPWHYLYRVNHPARGVVWIESHAVPQRDEDGGTTWHAVLHDVTARQHASVQTKLWADAFRHASHGLAVGDPNTRALRTCNAAYASLLGYAEHELVGRDIASLYCEADRPRLRELVARAAASGNAQGELRILRKDGSLVDVELSLVGVRDATGQPLYNIATLQDVSASKRAAAQLKDIAESLRTSEERFRLIFHESPAAKTLVRLPERFIVDANEAWLTLNRYRREDIIGKSTSVLKPDATDDHRADLARLLEHGSLAPKEHAVRRGDGTLGISEISARTFVLEGVTYAIVVHQDVTARRQAERALEESSARFKQLAESIHEVFWLTDIEKQSIVYVSPGYETIWGRPCKNLIDDATAWLEAIHPDDRERVRAALPKQAEGKYDEEYRVVRSDGTVRWVHDKGFPVRNDEGAVVGVAGVAQDVTERHALELQLRQAQKLESIGSLAGGVAHDFNNWLTVIGGSTCLLLERPDVDAESLEILADIKLATDRAAALTRQLLAFSRKEIVEPRVVNLNDVVADTERMLGRLIGEDVALTTDLAKDLRTTHVDKGQWSQVLINLAVNARDAMPRGGRLLIRTSNVEADELAHVLVEVTDSGSGMSPEVRARLFEPFFTTKAVGRGTGLGLAVVHGIITQSGGHVEVESTPDVGTTFRIFVPALPVEAAGREAAAESTARTHAGTETILLVEDEEALRRFIKRALLRDGYTVIEAYDGMNALDLVAAHPGRIDLVVTDVVMPRLGGRELVERLQAARPGLRVLYTSGYTDDAVLRHGVKQAEVALVPKPFTYSILRARIRELLDR